ncbi:MAG: S41 family peptidase [Holophagaceae bacterium]|nr:S41 family peptidase [Holophagaceae bacterium]
MRHLFFTVITSITFFAFAQDSFDSGQKKLLLASFEEVWATVKDKHYDPDLGGVDWQKVYEEYKPRIESAVSMDAGRNTINEMLGLLKQTHIGVFPAKVYADIESGNTGDYTPGIDLRALGGKAIVTTVDENSPAATAGVKPGWEVLKVDGKEVAPFIKRMEEHARGLLKELMASRVVLGMINGQPSELVEIEFHDGRSTKLLKLDRIAPRGSKFKFGQMPESYFWVETSSMAEDIRIIRFNQWLNPEAVASAFSKIMADTENTKGFIIDLRGNPGGIGGMAMGAAGWFTSQRGLKLGTMLMRGATINFIVNPRPNATSAPLAVLVDGCSASTTEIFAGGMQDLKRARIFGTPTAGAALPSAFVRLPNGDGFQYIMANYISEGGKQLEGSGVIPDEVVRLTQRELLAGRDSVLDKAIAWIKTQ